jgi:hypothetical protein
MRMAIRPLTESGSVPEYHEADPVWLISGKRPGKNCRWGRFVPPRRLLGFAPAIQKRQRGQSLSLQRAVGTALA